MLKGLRFETLEEAQAYLDRWEQRWADARIHGTTKRQVAAMFAEEKPTLLPLPLEPFRYCQYGERIVHLDGCVEVEATYYGAPPGWIGRVLRVQWGHRLPNKQQMKDLSSPFKRELMPGVIAFRNAQKADDKRILTIPFAGAESRVQFPGRIRRTLPKVETSLGGTQPIRKYRSQS